MTDDIMGKTIEEFNSKPVFVKYHTICAAAILGEQQKEERAVLQSLYKEGQGHSVLAVIGDMAIIESSLKSNRDNQFTAATINDGKWRHTNSYWPTIEHAMLDAIGQLHDGFNSRFAVYAGAMIGL